MAARNTMAPVDHSVEYGSEVRLLAEVSLRHIHMADFD